MFADDWQDDDDEDAIHVRPPIPAAYVTSYLHGGPFDGDTLQLPWARKEISLPVWDDDSLDEALYRLSGSWRGRAEAHYQHVEPEPEPLPEDLPVEIHVSAAWLLAAGLIVIGAGWLIARRATRC